MNIGASRIACRLEGISELDRLGDEIAVLSAHVEAAIGRLLDLICEFDARKGWGNGFRSCAHWLSWRVGLDPGAARERVRVAKALSGLPLLKAALARGELSYAKVRALTRVATPETESRLLGVGRAWTAAHVERIVRGWRLVDRHAEARASARQHERRGLHIRHDHDGTVVLHGRLTPEAGALLLKALEAAGETLYQRRRREEAAARSDDRAMDPPPLSQQRADALALMAETALHQGLDPGHPGEHYQVVVHVDAPVLSDPDKPGQSVLETGTHVSAETSQRLACDATRVVMKQDADGRITEIGARTRTIPPAIRRALQHRDRGCRFPGCGVAFGQGHHVRHWREGDPPRSRILSSCVVGTTGPSMKTATGSRVSRTARSSSGDRTAGPSRRCHRRLPCGAIRWRRCDQRTRRLACGSTRGRRPRGGWVSGWMWAGRSTCCTRWPRWPEPGEGNRGCSDSATPPQGQPAPRR